MPIKNGMQVVTEIRKFYDMQKYQNLVQEPVIVFFTAFLTPSFKKHALSIGVDKVYEKPM